MKRVVIAGIALLALLTVLLAAVHLTGQTPENADILLINGEESSFSELDLGPVSGSIVNGKGQKKQIDRSGISLKELITDDFDKITVTASDEYKAVLLKDELSNAYLIIGENSRPELVVFGDSDSKRNVRNVVRLDTE